MKKSAKKLLLVLCVAMALISSLLFVACGDDTPPTPQEGPEKGVYYNDDGGSEYTLTLSGTGSFTLVYKTENKTGDYTLSGETLNLSSVDSGAKYKGNTIELTYDGSAITFYKKVNFTVSFDSKGGSAVEAETVLNGKTVDKPVNPTYANHAFVAWCTDSACTTQYVFGSRVTGDVTLYAKWIDADAIEFTISFDANYQGAADIADTMTTVDGKLFFALPEAPAAPEGFTFGGWWVSTTDNGDELSYPADATTVFTQNTTLYAKWNPVQQGSKLAAPSVRITNTGFAWDRVNGANGYTYTITPPSGVRGEAVPVGANITSQNFEFTQAGTYVIEVVATAANPANNSAAGVCIYTAKALAKVSVFTVDGNVLKWNAVPNATKYLVTVACGDAGHVHTDVETTDCRYDFTDCEMTADGIEFTVKATATGYVPSEATFTVPARNLAQVNNISYVAADAALTWGAVENATEYTVVVKKDSVTVDTVTVRTNSFSLKTYAAGTYTVEITPKAHGYNSPAAATQECVKAGAAAPTDVRLEGNTLKWTAVSGETDYTVNFNGTPIAVEGATQIDLSTQIGALADGDACTITVQVAEEGSSVSEAITGKKNTLEGTPVYADGVVSWTPAIGASENYVVKLNNVAVGDPLNTNSCPITFTQKGDNEISVSLGSSTIKATVKTYEITFTDTLHDDNGVDLNPKYVASGDTLNLPEPTRTGYALAGWYNTVTGAGKRYSSGDIFADTADVALYAHYVANKYTVTLNPGEGNTLTGDKTVTVTYDSAFKFAVPTNDETNMIFMGWYTRTEGRGTQVALANGNCNSWTLLEDVALYAYWKDILTYTENETGYTVSVIEQNSGINELTIPTTHNDGTVTQVGDISNAIMLSKINIPNTVTYIAAESLREISGLEEINIIDAGADSPVYFSDDGIVYTHSNGGAVMFYVAPVALKGDLTIADGIASIPTGIFNGTVGRYTPVEYYSGTQITSITIPASVTYIAPEAFAYATKLNTVTILDPESGDGSALTIDRRAFRECIALTTVNLPARLTADGLPLTSYMLSDSKMNSDGVSIYDVYGDILKDPEDKGEEVDLVINDAFFGCSALKAINVAAGNANYSSDGGVLYNANKSTLLRFPAAKTGDFTVPNSVRTIAKGAFMRTTGVENVTVHYSGVKVDELAFYKSSVESVEFTGNSNAQATTVEMYAFRGSELNTLTFADNCNVTEIKEGAFLNSGVSGTVAIPASVTSIGGLAFANCTNLGSLTNKTGAAPELEKDVVVNCSSLKTIDISSNNTQLPSFVGCTSLETINMGENSHFTYEDGVIYDGSVLYYFDSTRTGTFTIPSNVTEIATDAFINSGLDKVIISNNVTKINSYAFRSSHIDEIEFVAGNSELVIDESAFATSGFKEIHLPTRVSSLGESAFEEMPLLEVLEFHEGLTVIPDGVANHSPMIKKIIIPSSVTKTGLQSFYYAGTAAENGMTVEFKPNSHLQKIEYSAFASSGLVSIEIPKSVTEIGVYAFRESERLASVTFESGRTQDLVLIHKENDSRLPSYYTGYQFYACKALTSISLPSRLTEIGGSAFYDCTSLANVTFESDSTNPSKLAKINQYAFRNTAIRSIVIPAPVTEIGMNAFYDCIRLLEVYNLSGLTFEIGKDTNGYVAYYAKAIYTSLDAERAIKTDTNGYEYIIEGDNASLIAYNGTDTALVLPDKFEGKNYAINANAFMNDTSIESITIPNGVTAIGSLAFSGCTSLETIVIPESIEEIASTAFKNCGIKNVTVPSKWLSVVKSDALVTAVITSGELNEEAFAYCGNLESVTLPSGIESIPDSAFNSCSSLTNISIPDTVKSIGSDAFYGCSELTRVVLPEGLTTLASGAFGGCSKLQYNIYENGNYMGSNTRPYMMFIGVIDKNVTSFKFHDGITEIPASAFSYNTTITSVTFSANMKKIGNYAFYGCEKLATIDLKDVETIGNSAFYNCADLKSLTLNSIKTIGNSAFADSGLTQISFGANLDIVGDSPFDGCDLLTKATFVPNFQYIPMMFDGAPNVVVENGTKLIAKYSDNGDGTKTLVKYYGNDSTKEFLVTADVSAIANEAFKNVSNLEKVTFAAKESGSDVDLTIGNDAFYGSSITEITLPARLVSIGTRAFYGCSNLKTVVFEENCKLTALVSFEEKSYWSTYYYGVFYNCTSLESVSLHEGLLSISNDTFYSSKIAFIGIPSTVTTIGDYAFDRTYSLTDVYFPGCADEAAAKAKYSNFNSFIGSKKPHYNEAAPHYESDTNAKYLVFTNGRKVLVEWIGKEASITINNVDAIGESAFENNTTVTSITLGDKVKSIGASAFSGCTKLANIDLTKVTSIGEYAFASTALTSVTLTACTSLGENAFENCGLLTTVSLGDNVTSIVNNAFSGCTKLSAIDLSKVTSIGEYAFENCKALASVTLNAAITAIEEGVFKGSGLTSFDFANITSIGASAFEGSALSTVTIPSTVTDIGGRAFANLTSVTSITLPEGYEYLPSVFAGVDESKIHGGVKKVVEYKIEGDKKILVKWLDTTATEITVGVDDGVTDIGSSAFSGIDSIIKVTIGSSVKTVGGQAFYDCDNLTSVEFLAGCQVTALDDISGYGVFESCSSLKTIVMPEGITSIGSWCFGSSVTDVYLPGYADAAAAEAAFTSGWSEITDVANVHYNTRPTTTEEGQN